MLEFLICRHNDTLRAQLALNNLQALVQHDQSDISWAILGICQQIQGDIQAALFSFQQSLRENSLCKIHHATRLRIQDINDPAVDWLSVTLFDYVTKKKRRKNNLLTNPKNKHFTCQYMLECFLRSPMIFIAVKMRFNTK